MGSVRVRVAAALALGLAAHGAHAAPPQGASARRAFFGDLHLHTAYSTDAVILGGTTTTLDDACVPAGYAAG
jgi:hypothetical protein